MRKPWPRRTGCLASIRCSSLDNLLPDRVVSSRWTKPRWPELRNSRIDMRGDGHGHAEVTRNGARTSVAAEILSCLERRDFWSRIHFAANREHGAAADEPVWLRQSIRNAIGSGVSTIVRTVCLQWYSLQP